MILLSSKRSEPVMSGLQQPPSSSTYRATYQAAWRHRDEQDVLIERLRACVALIAEQDPHDDRRAVWSRQVARLAEHIADEAARAELLRSLRDLVLRCTADERYVALAQIGDRLPLERARRRLPRCSSRRAPRLTRTTARWH